MPRFILALTLASVAAGCSAPAPARPFAIELEAAAIGFSRNDVAVPGDTGTRFPLDDLTGSGPFAGGRAYVTWSPAERHELRALAAPLSVSGTGQLDQPVSFAGENFAPGVPTRGSYRFDSYRLTYRYRFVDDPVWAGWIGVTGKIRDAEIELTQGGVTARKTDTGFVPLLHVAFDWRFVDDWRVALDVDGAWAPQGRAVDASLKAWWEVGDGVELGAGYRTIEGGADNDEVFTFAWVHQAVLSFRVGF